MEGATTAAGSSQRASVRKEGDQNGTQGSTGRWRRNQRGREQAEAKVKEETVTEAGEQRGFQEKNHHHVK